MKITAVVVTYNRLPLLKKVLDSLRKQTQKLDSIIVVNNGATDGTKEWLDLQTDISVIHQENVGGSGGFYTGIKTAFASGYDWLWCMDDDVFPTSDCLKKLLSHDGDSVGILCPSEQQNNCIYLTEKKKICTSNPFVSPKELTPDDIRGIDSVEIEGMTFEGPLIKREVVQKIGLPNKDLFITFDDTDYSYRAKLAGFKVLYIPKAILIKEFFPSPSPEEKVSKNKWKVWYYIRNGSYFYKTYGKNFLTRNFGMLKTIVFTLGSICVNYPVNKKYQLKDILTVIRMYANGLRGKLGKM